MLNFYIDGRKIEQHDRFGDGSRWFEMMLLPGQAEVAGPFTPIQFARHRSWGLDQKWADRCAVHAPMQDATDTYNGGFWPQKQCEPADVITSGARYGRQYRAYATTDRGNLTIPENPSWSKTHSLYEPKNYL